MRANPLFVHMEKIRYLVSIADAGSMLAAAKVLRIAQPSLSQSMKILEEALGVTLLIRARSGVRLTLEGRKIYNFAQTVMHDSYEVLNHLESASEMSGTLSVAFYEYLASSLWPKAQKQMMSKHKNLNFKIKTEVSNARMLEMLMKDEIDLFLGVESQVPRDVIKVRIFKESFSFYGREEALARLLPEYSPKSKISPAQFNGAPLLYMPHSLAGKGRTMADCLLGLGVLQDPAHEMANFGGMRALALEGLAVAVLPNFLSSFQPEQKKLTRLNTSFPSEFGGHDFYVCYHRSRAKDARIKALMDCLKDFQSKDKE